MGRLRRAGAALAAAVAVVAALTGAGTPAALGAGRVPYAFPESAPHCTAHFCVHWVATGADAPPLRDANADGVPDWVARIARVLESAYRVETGRAPGGLGWRPPPGDGGLGGSWNRIDVYLKDLGPHGVFGFTVIDPGQRGRSRTSYLVFDNDFSPAQYGGARPVRSLELTAPHELDHVLQYGYDALEDPWMLEATASWVQAQVYPRLQGLRPYVRAWARLSTRAMTLFDPETRDPANIKVYGSAVWDEWLAHRYGRAVVRDAFAVSAHTHPPSFAPGAYGAAIRRHGGRGFEDELARFFAATAEWREAPVGFPGAASLPDVRRGGALRPGAATVLTLDDTAYSLWTVPRRAGRMRVTGALPRGTAGALAVIVRRGDPVRGRVTVGLRRLPRGGRASIPFAYPRGRARVTAMIANCDVTTAGSVPGTGAWIFARDGARAQLQLAAR